MAFIPAILPWVMAATGVASALAESGAQQAQAKSSAYAADLNATALKQQGDVVMQQANLNEETQRKQARQVMGEQRAAIAQSGTGLGSSTNEKLMVQSAAAAEQDALNIRYGGLLEHHGLLAQANAETYKAKAIRSQLGNMKASGYLNAFGKGLGGYVGGGGKFGNYTGSSVSTSSGYRNGMPQG